MKIDFWQSSHDPVEKVVAVLARRVLGEGERLLVVAADREQRGNLSRALWQAGPESFLANGESDAPGAAQQPILLSDVCEPLNLASHIAFADGQFRETEGFVRAFVLFDDGSAPEARKAWRALDDRPGVERSLYRQEAGKWNKVL
jgi:DNA polymerase-3 subunit chi